MSGAFRDPNDRAGQTLEALLAGGSPFDLLEAAFLIAATEQPLLSVDHQIRRVHLIAAEGGRRAVGLTNPFARLDALQTYLFGELGFRGDRDGYDDARNSFLNDVLDRRLGIPLTLSILFLEVARAAGFEARGIALPGHFVTSVTFGDRTILVDPFHGGRVITRNDCRDLVTRTTGRPSLFKPEILTGADERGMLTRLLLNLKRIYVKAEEYDRALVVVDRLLLLDPDSPAELRDRGFLHSHLGRPVAALTDFQTYLSLAPQAPDAANVRGRIVWLRRRLSEAN